MPFGNLTSGSDTYEPRKPGVYEKSGLSIGSPRNEIRFTAGRSNSKTKKASMAVTRVRQKDFTPAGTTQVVREEANISVSWQLPTTGSFTQVDARAMLVDIHNVATEAILARLASGEN